MELDNIKQMLDEGYEFAKTYLKNNLRRNVLRITWVNLLNNEVTGDYTLVEPQTPKIGPMETNDTVAMWSLVDKDWCMVRIIDIKEVAVLKDYFMINAEGPVLKGQYVGKIAVGE
jgi:hypothetical protein